MRCLLIIFLFTMPAAAEEIRASDYDQLAHELNARLDFEVLPQRPEPGFRFDALFRSQGIWLGERFQGQRLIPPARHDRMAGDPLEPLKTLAGSAGQNLAVAYYRGFGSNALFPLGPDGIGEITGRGEGAVALMFDQNQ